MLPASGQRRVSVFMLTLGLVLSAGFHCAAEDQSTNAVSPGTLTLHPTYENMGVVLEFSGDANGNAKVSLQYRKAGEDNWRNGHPFVRVQWKKRKEITREVFATSMLFLSEGTEYEARAVVEDPDGVSAQPEPAKAGTRNSRVTVGGGKEYYVDLAAESGGDGSKDRPFNSLNAGITTGGPGDIVHFLPGIYTLKGTIRSTASGNEKAWLHYRAAPGAIVTDADPEISGVAKVKWEKFKQDVEGRCVYRAPVKDAKRVMVRKTPGDPASGYLLWGMVPDARGAHCGQNLSHLLADIPRMNPFGAYVQEKDGLYVVFPDGIDPATADVQISRSEGGEIWWEGHHVLFEGFTFELTAAMQVQSHKVKTSGDYIFRRLKCYGKMDQGFFLGERTLLEDSEFALNSFWDWFTAPEARDGEWKKQVVKSAGNGFRAWGKIKNGYNDTVAVRCLSDSVIRYNRFNRHSNAAAVNHAWAPESGNFDVYNNHFLFTGDDCIEPEGGGFNVRIYCNKLETFLNGISQAPWDRGPVFCVRNVLYGYIQGAIKVRNGSAGYALHYQNTCVPNVEKEYRPVKEIQDGKSCLAPDADGVRRLRTRNNIFVGREECYKLSRKLPEPILATIDLGHDCLWPKDAKQNQWNIEDKGAVWAIPEFMNLAQGDLRLKNENDPCVDAGEVVKGINDEVPEPFQYKGKAPDIGAYEFGAEAPHYGPRPAGK